MELLLVALVAATLLWSLESGRIATGWQMVRRAEHPAKFRLIAMSYALFAVVMLAVHVTGF
jgi:hypothetical protein